MGTDKNLRNLIIHLAFFSIIFLLFRFIVNIFFVQTDFYSNFIISDSFKPIQTSVMEKIGFVLLLAFIILNRNQIKNVQLSKVKISERVVFLLISVITLILYYGLRHYV